MKEKKTVHYQTFSEDVVISAGQDYELPKDYHWISQSRIHRLLSALIYAIVYVFSLIYSKCVKHCTVRNRQVLIKVRGSGYFVYANHTQPFGDVFIPVWVNRQKRIYTIASPANYGIPVIGKLLPYLGALPIPSDFRSMKKFSAAVSERIRQKHCVIVYPEAHVWPWYTGIRPYGSNAFHYPVSENAPVFAMTLTYQKRRFTDKPKITIYLDGPFYPDTQLSKKDQKEQLCSKVREAMQLRSKNSSYSYVEYIHEEEPET